MHIDAGSGSKRRNQNPKTPSVCLKTPEREFCDYDLRAIVGVLGLVHNMRSLNFLT